MMDSFIGKNQLVEGNNNSSGAARTLYSQIYTFLADSYSFPEFYFFSAYIKT